MNNGFPQTDGGRFSNLSTPKFKPRAWSQEAWGSRAWAEVGARAWGRS